MRAFDVVVIGGGAAGLFCAITAGKRGRSVAVLDHADKLGKKILISGGGRCNFTNRFAGPDNYLSNNPHHVKLKPAEVTEQQKLPLKLADQRRSCIFPATVRCAPREIPLEAGGRSTNASWGTPLFCASAAWSRKKSWSLDGSPRPQPPNVR